MIYNFLSYFKENVMPMYIYIGNVFVLYILPLLQIYIYIRSYIQVYIVVPSETIAQLGTNY